MIVHISVTLGLLCYAIAALLFAAEAWSQSPRQAIFIILFPGYVLYYALINSARELPFRLLLMVSILLAVVVPILAGLLQRASVQ